MQREFVSPYVAPTNYKDQDNAQLARRIEPNSPINPILSVRAFEVERLHGLIMLVSSTVDPKLTVWVTACLGTQLLCRQRCFLGTSKQNETIEKSANTTPSGQPCWVKRFAQSSGKPCALRRARQQLVIDHVFKTHEQCRKVSSITEDWVHPERQTRLSLTGWCIFFKNITTIIAEAMPDIVKGLSSFTWLKAAARTTDKERYEISWDTRTAREKTYALLGRPLRISTSRT